MEPHPPSPRSEPDVGASHPRARSWSVTAALLGVPVAVFLIQVLLCFPYINDDAFISFRYASNLVDGHGLVFNPGERVEGYTNFLWVLVSAVFVALGAGEKILLWAKVCGVALSVGTVCVTYRIQAARHPRSLVPFLTAALLASSMSFAANTVSGLETALYALLLTVALYSRVVTGRWQDRLFVGSMALAALTRPEGFFLFATLTIVELVRSRDPRRFLVSGATFAALTAPYLVWKLLFYGSLLPNTYYAKEGSLLGGAQYVWSFLSGAGFTLYLGLPLVLLVIGLARRNPDRFWLSSFLAAEVAAVVLSGGDWMVGWRFLVPVLPVVCIGLANGVAGVHGLLEPRWPRAAGIAVLVTSLSVFHALGRPSPAIAAECHARGEGQVTGHLEVGRWLRQHGGAADTAAMTDIGMVGYFSRLRVIDISGLTDALIGRSSGPILRKVYDTDYVLDQEPEFVVMVCSRAQTLADGTIRFDPAELWFQEARIWANPRFRAHYRVATVYHASFEGYLLVFARQAQ
jgi:hypothetical protein